MVWYAETVGRVGLCGAIRFCGGEANCAGAEQRAVEMDEERGGGGLELAMLVLLLLLLSSFSYGRILVSHNR